jgi:multidrug efflux pump subunit AcrA (membrane-fusion protein)
MRAVWIALVLGTLAIIVALIVWLASREDSQPSSGPEPSTGGTTDPQPTMIERTTPSPGPVEPSVVVIEYSSEELPDTGGVLLP